jgi:luciferase family oxidoreductase group 1
MALRLSVLDQSTAIAGRSQDESIRESMALARYCESLGYARYWLAEHHNHDTIAGTAPEVLMAAIAATTHSIRVGSAGIMLPNHSTFKVAEQFRVLEAIAPGRIDLGLGRAPGSDRLTAHALNPNVDQAAADFPAHIRDLMAWLDGSPLAAEHPFHRLRAFPSGPSVPEVWILGSSDYGAQVAAHFGLPYCFAHFITDGMGAEQAIGLYRQRYRPSPRFPAPYAALCVWALAAEHETDAAHLFASRERWKCARDRGQLLPVMSPEDAAAHPYTPAERAQIDELRRTAFFGAAPRLAQRLRRLAADCQVEEVAILTWCFDAQARRHSYQLLAQEFELVPRTSETL